MAISFAEREAAKYPEFASVYQSLAKSYSTKLWYQATETLLKFVRDPASARGSNLVDLWSEYIKPAAGRLDPIKFAHLTALCAQYHLPDHPELARLMLDEVLSSRSVGEEHDNARRIADLETGIIALRSGDAKACEAVVEKHEEAILALEDADRLVAGTFHRVAAELYKATGDADKLHSACLAYLTQTHTDDLAPMARVQLAVDLATSAINAAQVFSFAEVLEHPVSVAIGAGPGTSAPRTSASGAGAAAASSSASSSSAAPGLGEDEVDEAAAAAGAAFAWLTPLMQACDEGDVEGVAILLAEHGGGKGVVADVEAFKQKVVLMTLMALAASRPASERSLGYGEVAARCGIPEDQVEWVVMRACAKGLIRATMDGELNVVQVEYVRPRALGLEAVGHLAGAVRGWSARTHEQLMAVEHGARDIMA